MIVQSKSSASEACASATPIADAGAPYVGREAWVKFAPFLALAAEALRGVGGLILNKDGKRFANELGRRDYVTGDAVSMRAGWRS